MVRDELLAHVGPTGWGHINLTGDYLWPADGEEGGAPGSDGFRPLRRAPEAHEDEAA